MLCQIGFRHDSVVSSLMADIAFLEAQQMQGFSLLITVQLAKDKSRIDKVKEIKCDVVSITFKSTSCLHFFVFEHFWVKCIQSSDHSTWISQNLDTLKHMHTCLFDKKPDTSTTDIRGSYIEFSVFTEKLAALCGTHICI